MYSCLGSVKAPAPVRPPGQGVDYPSDEYRQSAERGARYEAMIEPREVQNRHYYAFKAQNVPEIEEALDAYVVSRTEENVNLFLDPVDRFVRSSEIQIIATAVPDPEHRKPGTRLGAWCKDQRDDRERGVLIRGIPLEPITSEPIEAKATKYVEPAFDIRTTMGTVLYPPKGGWKLMSEATTLSYLTSFVRSYWPWIGLGALGIWAGVHYAIKGS